MNEKKDNNEFLSSISHEIRTALNTIVGLSDDINDYENIPEEIREDAEDLNAASKSLLELLDNVLDFIALGGKAEKADKESRMGAGSFRGDRSEGRRNREERRSDKEVGYHRVYVTGLNSAVWPDPPGYHEKKEREMAAAAAKAEKEKAQKSKGKRRPRPHRKTEGGTGNSK